MQSAIARVRIMMGAIVMTALTRMAVQPAAPMPAAIASIHSRTELMWITQV